MDYFKVKHLACIKGKQPLFKDLNFSLSSGELLLIQGSNGSGKSSLLKILAGLASCDRGQIENKSEIAYLSHKPGIKSGLTVLENIRLQLALVQCEYHPGVLNERLAAFALDHKRDTLCGTLSMGQQRKVALVSVLLKRKPVWLLDEPFTGLDKPSVLAFCQGIKSHLSTGGMVMIASHAVEGLSPHHTIELLPC